MREQSHLVSVDLPVPPSVNSAFAARRGSHLTQKTAIYRFWEREVLEEHRHGQGLPVLVPGGYGLWLDLATGMRGDIDNRIKLVSDILKVPTKTSPNALGVVIDDGHMKGLHVEFLPGLAVQRCVVTVVALAWWPSYVCMRIEA